MLKFHLERSHYSNVIELQLYMVNDHEVLRAKPVEYEKVDEGEIWHSHQPLLSLKTASAQELIDALWQVGFRPTEGTGSAGSLAATQNHLKDMQAIAMALLRKDGANV